MDQVPTRTKLTGVLILVIGAVAAIAAYSMNKVYKASVERDQLALEELSDSTNYRVTPTTSPTPTPHPLQISVEDEQTIPSLTRSELTLRVINPIVDYYKDASQSAVIRISITKNTSSSRQTYPFLGTVDLESGAKLGFVIEQKGSSLQYWKPECMNGCQFTDEYKKKYPQVVQ